MDQPNYYAIIPASVRYDKRLTGDEKIMYGELSALSNKNGYCWASNGYFAKLYGITPQGISKRIHGLEEAGYIRIEFHDKENGVRERRISILDPGLNNKEDQPVVERDQPGVEGGINPELRGYQPPVEHINKDNTTSNNTSDAIAPAKEPSKMRDTVAQRYQELFLIEQPIEAWGNIAAERSQLNTLAKKTRALQPKTPYLAGEIYKLIGAIFSTFLILIRRGETEYWRNCPRLPSALSTRWGAVCSEMARRWERENIIREAAGAPGGNP